MYYVYLLQLSNHTIYTGCTDDLKKRLQKHTHGEVLATKKYLPLQLIWYSSFLTRPQARRFEAYLKSGSGQAFRNKHLLP